MNNSREDIAMGFTVGITTRNRPLLLRRAIESVLRQTWSTIEIIVVDDASTDDSERVVKSIDKSIRFFRNETQRGPNAGRNLVIRESSSPWVLFLDDDDELESDALQKVIRTIAQFPDSHRYPVLQFVTTRGHTRLPFVIAHLKHYLDGTLNGDFTPAIQRDLFLQLGLAYPPIRVGGESLLWWKIADEFGIPTWNTQLVRVGTEAQVRLTSVDHQLLHAGEYADLQEMILEQYGKILRSQYPLEYRKRVLGAATYLMLAGNRKAARAYLADLLKSHHNLPATALWSASFAPRWLVRCLFRFYRRMSTD